MYFGELWEAQGFGVCGFGRRVMKCDSMGVLRLSRGVFSESRIL